MSAPPQIRAFFGCVYGRSTRHRVGGDREPARFPGVVARLPDRFPGTAA